jgi:anti-sigma regulatory factor (Ser/Thr protein kinase)
MESAPIHLSVTSHPKNLKRIRRVMADVTSKTDLSKEIVGSIILAVDEVCSNIIKHCCMTDPNRKIDLTIQLETDSLVISIVDDGIKFDINSIKSRDINDIKPGGLGIHIIKQVMDTVDYSHTPEGFNKVKMIKKLKG